MQTLFPLEEEQNCNLKQVAMVSASSAGRFLEMTTAPFLFILLNSECLSKSFLWVFRKCHIITSCSFG